MAQHSLSASQEIIDGLDLLGRSLQYTVRREFNVAPSGAAVDVAWLNEADDETPLMIFEVESTASASMANNAMKVLTQDVGSFMKPLFFFHVLLKGGPNNERIAALQREWGRHNYRVYRLNDPADKQCLIHDILGQHRRINRRLMIRSVGHALADKAWREVDRFAVFRWIEDHDLRSNFLRDYTILAIDDRANLPALLDRIELLRSSNGPSWSYDHDSYHTYFGDQFGGIFEVALLIRFGRIADADAADAFEQWQTSSGLGMRLIGPNFGLSRDYDKVILGAVPALMGAVGLLLRAHPVALTWLIQELHALLAAEAAEGINRSILSFTAMWLTLIAAPTSSRSGSLGTASSEAMQTASSVIVEAGGIPVTVLEEWPLTLDLDEPEYFLDPSIARVPMRELMESLSRPIPKADRRYQKDNPWPNPLRAVLRLLIEEDWPLWSGWGLALALQSLSDDACG